MVILFSPIRASSLVQGGLPDLSKLITEHLNNINIKLKIKLVNPQFKTFNYI
jgi:hypothetical protein